jgi:hypothetical protein
MSNLLARAQAAKSIVDNGALPKWRRVTQALQALAGLELTGLPVEVSAALETKLVAIDRILATYRLTTADDYAQMKDADLQQILDILGKLLSPIAQAN